MGVDTTCRNLLSERRSRIAAALNRAVETFDSFSVESFQEVMSGGLLPIADAVGLDRIAVYSYRTSGGSMSLGQIYRWDRAERGVSPLKDTLIMLPGNGVVENWKAVLAENRCVSLQWNTMTDNEKCFMSLFGARSVMLVPIFICSEFRGAVAFLDHARGQNFSDGCEDLINAAARLCVGAIVRNDSIGFNLLGSVA